MKKILSFLLIFTCLLTFFAGCANIDGSLDIASTLDKNLNKLQNIVKKLDTIDTNYISNPDIISSQKLSLPNNKTSETYSLAFNNYDEETNNLIKNIIVKNLQEKYLNNNGNCSLCNNEYICNDDGYCNSCGNTILCDENGNCTNCNQSLILDENFNCKNCNNYALINKFNASENAQEYKVDLLSTKPSLQQTESTKQPIADTTSILEPTMENKNIFSEFKKSNNIVKNNLNNKTNKFIKEYNNKTFDTENLPNNIVEAEQKLEENKQVSDDRQDNKSNTKYYFYTRESFEPIKLKYKPRYISEYNENNINDQLANYLYKVQKLYAMTEDAIEANTILNDCKYTLINSVEEVKNLNENIINGSCTPNVQQLQALQNYSYDIKNTIKNLKACNGDLTDEVNNIANNVPTSITTGVDVLNSNYMRLINQIDTRITYHESAIATLEQIKYIISEAMGKETITDEEIENVIEQLIESNESLIESEEFIENNSSYSENENINPTEENKNKSEFNVQDETQNTLPEEIILFDTPIKEVDSNVEDETIDTNLDNNETETQQNVTDNIEDKQNDNNTQADTTTPEDDNIDASKETKLQSETENSLSNIDTYKNPTFGNNLEDENNNDAEENLPLSENYVDNNDTQNKNIDGNAANTNTNASNSVLNNQNTSNAILNNNTSMTGPINNGNIYTNNTGYNNSVITQNNLNNNDGFGGYYYTSDGEIKNNGINNDNNEFGNNGNTIENNLNRNNNVNTYGYNTMLDVLNQGTVNNGINTLQLKPNYINNNVEIIKNA